MAPLDEARIPAQVVFNVRAARIVRLPVSVA
jgi:hypothetical protein